DKSDCHCVIF
ncbi:hypothetical protein DBR06_SOUSAS29110009, partial [Sousa chinensis]